MSIAARGVVALLFAASTTSASTSAPTPAATRAVTLAAFVESARAFAHRLGGVIEIDDRGFFFGFVDGLFCVGTIPTARRACSGRGRLRRTRFTWLTTTAGLARGKHFVLFAGFFRTVPFGIRLARIAGDPFVGFFDAAVNFHALFVDVRFFTALISSWIWTAALLRASGAPIVAPAVLLLRAVARRPAKLLCRTHAKLVEVNQTVANIEQLELHLVQPERGILSHDDALLDGRFQIRQLNALFVEQIKRDIGPNRQARCARL